MFCCSTRVIKVACGPDIGRVVKIRKQAAAVFPPRRDRGGTSPPTTALSTGQPMSHNHHRSGSSTTTATSSSSSLYPSSTHHSHHVQNGGVRSSTSSPSLGGRTTSNAISPLPRSAASPSYPTASTINSSTTSSSNEPIYRFTRKMMIFKAPTRAAKIRWRRWANDNNNLYPLVVLFPDPPSIFAAAMKDGYANGVPMMETNPELMRRPLRERIIHLLAIRSYKKPELVTRLHRGWSWSSLIGGHDRSRTISTLCLVQRVSRRRTRSWSCPSCLPSASWRIKPIT